MTWSTPDGPVERIPAPNVAAQPVGEPWEARGDTPGAGNGNGSGHDSGYRQDPGYGQGFGYGQDSGYGQDAGYGHTAPSDSWGPGGNAAQAAPSQHLAYPVTPYVQAPYTAPRPAGAGTLTLSVVALCLSGGSFFVSLIPILQFVWWMVGIAGIVCGFIALRREPRGRALAITAIVLGFISVFGLLLLLVLALLFFGGIGLLGGLSSY
ncbi:hypothetical protein C5E07_10755 [Pseudoclavibacter sp. RFBJ3]|uniref:DUF4190 domain-containing protein n=1 Tax=unclassified Pseudoclavibacter TaxID=2615177 RepID=UPI000CE8DFC4|nr:MULTISPECIES: DUF4190 domain-containing protein [unclassified Pseudoclavibacter]MBF4550127.1 DUF4190 domain-containing protein [Pseudoclavibacter sp. VKM Ac-2888]PPF38594.1 hypothetical protein C5E05_06255 [Pseudoclavibacter sp. AY1H1]PPF74981.1 hypothetical protein C5B99_12645 [Pseudoclavibacter sp. Z016]PPF83947.1 hypothetical protein C5C12_09835 [Pseudoclavibacter sp. RFBJ5]PPF92227.1 hypothetical protein C5E07_10755 [Pseudoclavibacter sp. RFBJ3]